MRTYGAEKLPGQIDTAGTDRTKVRRGRSLSPPRQCYILFYTHNAVLA